MLKKRIVTAVSVTVLFGCTVFMTLAACQRKSTSEDIFNESVTLLADSGEKYSESGENHTGRTNPDIIDTGFDTVTEETSDENSSKADGIQTDSNTHPSQSPVPATQNHEKTHPSNEQTAESKSTAPTTMNSTENGTETTDDSETDAGDAEKFVFTSIKVNDEDYDYYTYLTQKKGYVPVGNRKELAKHCVNNVLSLDAGRKSVSYIITGNGIFDEIADKMDKLREAASESVSPADIYARDSYLYEELGLDYYTYYSRGIAIFMFRKIQDVTNSRGDYSVYAIYYYSYETADQIKLTESVVKHAVSGWSGSDYDRIRSAYDYLRQQCKYAENVDEPMAHSAYGALVNKSAVCEGYAKAYKLLLDEMGIENDIVFNDVHAWNMVKYEGNRYLVDVTNGDVNDTYAFFMLGKDIMYSNKNCKIGNFIFSSGTIAGYGYINGTNTDRKEMALKSLMYNDL